MPADRRRVPRQNAAETGAGGAPGERLLDVDGTAARYADQIVWATIATLNGLPATTLPIARSPEGLPIGAQLIGAFLEDRTTIALAGMIERALGCAFTPPPGY